MIIFEKEYDGESLIDLEDDVGVAISCDEVLPVNEHGFIKGTFRVTISWEEGNE